MEMLLSKVFTSFYKSTRNKPRQRARYQIQPSSWIKVILETRFESYRAAKGSIGPPTEPRQWSSGRLAFLISSAACSLPV